MKMYRAIMHDGDREWFLYERNRNQCEIRSRAWCRAKPRNQLIRIEAFELGTRKDELIDALNEASGIL